MRKTKKTILIPERTVSMYETFTDESREISPKKYYCSFSFRCKRPNKSTPCYQGMIDKPNEGEGYGEIECGWYGRYFKAVKGDFLFIMKEAIRNERKNH